MSTKRTYLICDVCKNQVGLIHDGGGKLVCCGQPMRELASGTVDASHEKHVPALTRDGDTVRVNIGSVDHPMIDEHYIEWVALAQDGITQRVTLKPGDAPHVDFTCIKDSPVKVYAYCNLHGLWEATL